MAENQNVDAAPTTANEQLELAVKAATEAAGLPLAEGVLEELRTVYSEVFSSPIRERQFPRVSATVLRSATFAGRFARLYAEYAGSPVIRMEDARAALLDVKGICPADVEAEGRRSLEWCA